MFAGFFRISELLNVKIKDVTFFESRVEIFLPKSKCDQLQEGNIIYISKTGPFCPIHWLEKYFKNNRVVSNLSSLKNMYRSQCPWS